MYVLIVISAGKNFQNYIPGCILGNYYGKPDESSRKDPDGNKNYRSNLKLPELLFTNKELKEGLCTPCKGRTLLNQECIEGIRCKWLAAHIHIEMLVY